MATNITILSVRFATPSEAEAVKRSAERAGVNISAFLREAALRYVRALDAGGGAGWEARKMRRRIKTGHLRVIEGGGK